MTRREQKVREALARESQDQGADQAEWVPTPPSPAVRRLCLVYLALAPVVLLAVAVWALCVGRSVVALCSFAGVAYALHLWNTGRES
jgi:hypothetical protein